MPKQKLTKGWKRRIAADWAGCFPDMSVYEPMQLLRRVGPLLIGIALDRDSSGTCYIPTFHVHCLCRPSEVIPLTLRQVLISERSQYKDSIEVSDHERRYLEAAQRLARQAALPLSGDVSFEQVMRAYSQYRKKPLYECSVHLPEEMALMCSERGDVQRAKVVVEETYREMWTWPDYVLKKFEGPDAWRERVEQLVSDPASLRQIVAEEIVKHKLEAVAFRELLP